MLLSLFSQFSVDCFIQVVEAGFFGTHHQCSTRLDGLDHPLKIRLPQKRVPRPGEELALYVDPSDLVLLTR